MHIILYCDISDARDFFDGFKQDLVCDNKPTNCKGKIQIAIDFSLFNVRETNNYYLVTRRFPKQ